MRWLPILLLLAPLPAAAQAPPPDGLTLSANTRLRYETIDGQPRVGPAGSEDLLNIRTILAAEYRAGPFAIGGELWDSRAYDAGPNSAVSTSEVNAIEPVQAWVSGDLGAVLGSGSRTRVQVGRFLLNLGSRRLVAADEYRNTTNGYTGVRVDFDRRGGWSATAIYVLPQQRLPADARSVRANEVVLDREGGELRLFGVTAAKARVIGPLAIDAAWFRLVERDRPDRAPTRDRRLDTISLRLLRAPAPGSLDLEFEGIRQTGSIASSLAAGAARLPVAAWFAHAEVGYQLAAPWRPRIALEYDFASGDRPGGRYGRFDTLYGMRRADLAPAGLYNALGRTNLAATGVRIEVTPSTRLDAFLSVRDLRLASRYDAFSTTGVRDPSGTAGRHAGTQLDGRVRWWAVPKRLQLELDAVLLAKGGFLRTAPNAPATGDTRYLSLNATAFF